MDIWNFTEEGDAICIPTNTMVKRDGTAVMGAGLALQAARQLPDAPAILGASIATEPSKLIVNIGTWGSATVLSFPTKRDWRNPSNLDLIRSSATELLSIAARFDRIIIPRVGGGLGGLDFEREVKPLLQAIFDNNSKFLFI
jgi:hypothetical protein